MNDHSGLRALLLLALSALPLSAQGLLFSPQSAADLGVGPRGVFGPADIALQPVGAPLRRWYDDRGLDVLLGDRNGDGELRDAPARIDALARLPGLDDDPLGVAMSFSTNFSALDGTLIRDGDVVRLLGGGVVDVIVAEGDLAMATGTGAIDVDAFHLDLDGSLYFSFAEDEVTTSAALIAQNDGAATLDEASLFRLGPDGSVTLVYDRDDLAAIAANATGVAISSVVDLQGVTEDPDHPGEFLLTFGSANDALEGRVFSTQAGGTLFSRSGQDFDSSGFGFNGLEILGALAWIDSVPPLISLVHPDEVGGPLGSATIFVTGMTPGNTARLAIADTRFPAETSVSLGFAGRDAVLVDPSHPFLNASLADPMFATTADAGGVATFSYDVSLLPPGLALTMQAFETETLVVSPAIATLTSP